MSSLAVSYKNHRFPPQIIVHAVWLYLRFPLSLRLVEEMLLERGIAVSYEISGDGIARSGGLRKAAAQKGAFTKGRLAFG